MTGKEPLLGERGQNLARQAGDWRLPALLFDSEGRIGRRTFWLYFLAVMVTACLIFFIRPLRQTPAVHIGFAVVLLLPSYAIFAKRFQDFDMPGAWALAIVGFTAIDLLLAYSGLKTRPGRWAAAMAFWSWFMLIITTFVILALGTIRGSEGENRYGLRWPPW